VVHAQRPGELRCAIVRAQQREAANGRLLVGLTDFVDALVADDVFGRFDFALARDLIAVRLIEKLFEKGWFSDKRDLLDELDEDGAPAAALGEESSGDEAEEEVEA